MRIEGVRQKAWGSIFLLEIKGEMIGHIAGFWVWGERKPIAPAMVNVSSWVR